MGFRIIVDSCCDMSLEMKKNAVFVNVPLTIHCGGRNFVDDSTLNQADLLSTMKQSEDAPTTSCPSPQAYLDAMDCGEEDVYVVTLSAALSGSHNSAQAARTMLEEEKPNVNVHVFNSRSASSGETLVALKVKELAQTGISFKEVVQKVEQFISHMHTLFILESLENLRKNGRLRKLQAVIAAALHIKLFLHGTPEGEIGMLSKALSMRQALNKMVSYIAADGSHNGSTLIISHCNCPDRASWLKDQIERRCAFANIIIVETQGIATVYADNGGIVCAY
jgi:DegV family protein with EDD domain